MNLVKKGLITHKEHSQINAFARALRKAQKNTIVDFDETVDLNYLYQAHSLNDMVRGFRGNMFPSRISHHVLALITSGSGEKEIGSHRFNIEANMLMIIPRFTIHLSKNWDLSTQGYMLTFDEQLFAQVGFPEKPPGLMQLLNPEIVPFKSVSEKYSQEIIAVFKQILQELRANHPEKDYLIALKISELIILFNRAFSPGKPVTPDSDISLYHRFSRMLERNFLQQHDVSFYADSLCVHPNYLNASIKKFTGKSAKQNIQQRIFLEAKFYLKVPHFPIKEIAYRLGFEDPNYFSRCFRESEGLTPSTYRKQNL